MATCMMAGQSCKLLQVICGIRHLQISHIQQPCITGLNRLVSTGTVVNTRSGELKNFPQKPKLPPNVFVMYLQKVEQEIKKSNPDIKRTELVRQVSRMWHDLDPEQKSHLAMMRRDLYEKYKENLRVYLENITPEQVRAEKRRNEQLAFRKLKQVRKALGMPKKPLSSFGLFVSEKFADRGDESVPVYFKLVLNEWGRMSDAEKEIYKQKAAVVKHKYVVDVASWEKEMIAQGRFDVIRKTVLTKLLKAKKGEKKKNVGFSIDKGHDSD